MWIEDPVLDCVTITSKVSSSIRENAVFEHICERMLFEKENQSFFCFENFLSLHLFVPRTEYFLYYLEAQGHFDEL